MMVVQWTIDNFLLVFSKALGTLCQPVVLSDSDTCKCLYQLRVEANNISLAEQMVH